jgi:hypothetical protein
MTCYREVNGVYFTRNTHRNDCADPTCRGCKPCTQGHCTARQTCAIHVATGELTCGRCISRTRRDLHWIRDMEPLLPTAAVTDGVESEAANLAGPAADPARWSARRVAMRGHLATWFRRGKITEGQYLHARATMEDDDELHPYTVLGRWDMMIREDYGHPSQVAVSVRNAAAYLDEQLHRIAQDGDQDFPLLARELRRCRSHIESVLHNDTRPDRGTLCPDCHREGAEHPPRLVREYGHWCDDEDCERLHYSDEAGDRWVCPRNRNHWWTEKDYRGWVEERHRAETAV